VQGAICDQDRLPDLNPESENLANAIFGGYPGSPAWFSLLHALFYGKNAGGWTSNQFMNPQSAAKSGRHPVKWGSDPHRRPRGLVPQGTAFPVGAAYSCGCQQRLTGETPMTKTLTIATLLALATLTSLAPASARPVSSIVQSATHTSNPPRGNQRNPNAPHGSLPPTGTQRNPNPPHGSLHPTGH
jgi:hypothetical protein